MGFDRRVVRAGSFLGIGAGLLACLLFFSGSSISAQESADAPPPASAASGKGSLTAAEVVEKLGEMNLRRAQALRSYRGTRTYRVKYGNSFTTMSAEMVVEAKYAAPETKQFTIQSSSGSKLLIDKVFTKILKAEHEAVSADARRSTALSSDNYDFTMVGFERTPAQSMYVLAVEPKTKNKFLFRGRVWVDGDDFAVVRIEAEPAKNPSFWTQNSEIEQLYIKVDDFWLPERNHSVSSIRFGGRAELTIEYQNYQITAADPVDAGAGRAIAGAAIAGNPIALRSSR